MPTRRNAMFSMAALAAATAAAGAFPPPDSVSFDAVVSKKKRRDLPAAPRYPTIKAALAAAPAVSAKPFRILISAGIWRERPVVDKPFVHLTGEGRDKTVIVYNLSAGDPGPDGKPLGTFGTPTLTVSAPDFAACHLTVSNDYDYPASVPPPVATDKTGKSGSQAVAISIEGLADRSRFDDVAFHGYQDTLFADVGRCRFTNCLIEGCVDFIFGRAPAVFENCEIRSLLRPGQDFQGFVVAPDTKVGALFGFVFHGCRLTKAAGVGAHTVALGRPWRHTVARADGRYGDPEAVPAAAYIHCWMDDHILPEGWVAMGYTSRWGQKTQMTPEEARFYEYDSYGPGAGKASASRRILSERQAKLFDAANILDGWQG